MDDPHFRVLGPVEVQNGGRLLPVTGKSLTALTCLLLSANHTVPVDTMAEWVWGDAPPEHRRAALHNIVSRLRRTLNPGIIETMTGGYRLVTDAEHLDLVRFRRLIAAAGRSVRHGADAEVTDLLREALDLWREPLLANVDSAEHARDAIDRLAEQYLQAYEMRAEACLRLGWNGIVIDELAELVHAHPFRETMAHLLIVALARGNRRADALTTYTFVRRALSEELGIEPGKALQELHLRILRDQPAPIPKSPYNATVIHRQSNSATIPESAPGRGT